MKSRKTMYRPIAVLLIGVLVAGCRPQVVRTVEVVLTSPASIVEVTATPEPTPAPITVTVCANGCDFTTIQAAIDDARTISGSIINIADAVHTEMDITVNKDVTIRGQGADLSIVQAHQERDKAEGRVFFVVEGVTATIEGMTIRHGRPDMEPRILGVRRSGGAIVNQGTLTLTDCIVRDNIASSGGGIWNNGDLMVSECVFTNNVADGIDEQLGQNCGSGGGIKSAGEGALWLVNSTVTENSADGYGGGVKGSCGGTLEIVNSTISSNDATESGGGVNIRSVAKIVNSTISGNSSGGKGGGIYIGSDSVVETVHCTIVGNRADFIAGGGIYVQGTLDYSNNIIASNVVGVGDPKAGDCANNGSISDNANNLVQDGSCGVAWSGDPMLDVLSDNGGDTQTHALLPDSPAINTIPADNCLVAADQRGTLRPQGAGCDIGAYESIPSTPTSIPPTATPFVSPYDYDELLDMFSYDSEVPLDIQEEAVTERDGIQIHSISYASPKGRVSAYLVVPPGEGPFAGIIFVHWGLGNRDQFLDEAVQFAKMGAVSLLMDAPWNRPYFFRPDLYLLYIQTVLDLQRSVDLLVARPDVDIDRIGYVGHSYGATWGGVLAGVEKRIKAYVLMAGGAQISKTDGPNKPEIDAINYIGHAAPSAVFFQFAENDEYITEESAWLFYDVASEPKFIQWYDTSHRFNDQARDDRVEWLSAQLELERGQ